MSMTVTSVPDAYQVTNKSFNLDDPHQQPNLSFFSFKPMPRDAWVRALCNLYPMPGKDDPTRGFFMRHEKRARAKFVDTWIDRFIARGDRVQKYYREHDRMDLVDPATLQFLEVMPDGMLRRGLVQTRVHYAEPENDDKEDLSDVAVPQTEWPSVQPGLAERQRLARKADLTVGELEELQRRLRSEGTQG